MKLKKINTLKTDTDLPSINLQSSTQTSKPIKLPFLLLSPAPQRKNNLSFHQHPKKVSPDSISTQNFKSFRERSITLNRKNLSQFIQPNPLQSLQRQHIVHKFRFEEQLEKNKSENQQSRDCYNEYIQTDKNNSRCQNNRKIYQNQFKLNDNKTKSKVGQQQTKHNQIQKEQSQKKYSFQCFQKIIPKYHQEYTKQVIKQQPNFLEFGNFHYQDNQQKWVTDYEIALNMSEIQEMNEDVLSSKAQSTFFNKVC
ncbi:unnamed protein product [Paramecium pentaurelia]|uniref:Uncharacterized protein n=1 Tax=Paramecium pentaurelia TaxID=43138 RepID=A0A8S1VZS9_9CILI|nr:unnamed protein product [Paramecium pentaurelia]